MARKRNPTDEPQHYTPTLFTGYWVTDGEASKYFVYVSQQASADAAFGYAAHANFTRDEWAKNAPLAEALNTKGRRYSVTEYRSYWNDNPGREQVVL